MVYMLPGHLEWCLRAYAWAAASHPGEHVAIAVLQYTLTPWAKHPTQLKQAASGLAHLLKSGVRPRDLIIGGDSAGGNLTAGVLGHLLHPHPEAERIELAEPLAGAFLVSPWVSGHVNWDSFRANHKIDMLSTKCVTKCIGEFVGGVESFKEEVREGKGWATPTDVDTEEWFKGLGTVVSSIYITCGQQEVFLDQCRVFHEAIRRGNPDLDVRYEEPKDEAHDFILLEGGAKHTDGPAMKRMRAWASTVFWG